MSVYKNVTGTSAVELLSRGSNSNDISSILLSSVHASTAAIVDLFIQDSSLNTYYFIKGVTIPLGTSLVLTDNLNFNNSNKGFALFIILSAGSVDVHIKQD
tara:strand:+ start:865 stop:1167 length:303 start_codon:yes stop_codon:yes gene_type:complete